MTETNLSRKVAAFFKCRFGLARESYDDVGGDVEVGTESLDALAHLTELVGRIVTVHTL